MEKNKKFDPQLVVNCKFAETTLYVFKDKMLGPRINSRV